MHKLLLVFDSSISPDIPNYLDVEIQRKPLGTNRAYTDEKIGADHILIVTVA